MMRRWGWLIFLLIGLLWGTAAFGQEDKREGKGPDSPWETYSFKFGGFLTALESDVELGLNNVGTGITVNVEDALGLQSSMTVFRADFGWRFGSTRKHMLDVAYSDFRRSASKTLSKTIEIGDEVYPVGTTVESEFNFSIITAKYTYSLYQDDRFNFGLGIGAYVMPVEFKISENNIGNVEENFTAPLPVLGARFDFAVTPKFFVRQSLDLLYLEIGDFRGTIVDISFGAEYKFWKHFGIGADVNIFRIAVEADGEDYPGVDLVGKFNFGYNAIMLYGKLYF
jgi:hypothetical protein